MVFEPKLPPIWYFVSVKISCNKIADRPPKLPFYFHVNNSVWPFVQIRVAVYKWQQQRRPAIFSLPLAHCCLGDDAQCSGGNDRFCARLKKDISAFSSGLQGHLRSCLTILDSSRRPLSKNVRHDLVRPRRPELEAKMSVFNLAHKRSFPPTALCDVSPMK
jgi:hypothetical protein